MMMAVFFFLLSLHRSSPSKPRLVRCFFLCGVVSLTFFFVSCLCLDFAGSASSCRYERFRNSTQGGSLRVQQRRLPLRFRCVTSLVFLQIDRSEEYLAPQCQTMQHRAGQGQGIACDSSLLDDTVEFDPAGTPVSPLFPSFLQAVFPFSDASMSLSRTLLICSRSIAVR